MDLAVRARLRLSRRRGATTAVTTSTKAVSTTAAAENHGRSRSALFEATTAHPGRARRIGPRPRAFRGPLLPHPRRRHRPEPGPPGWPMFGHRRRVTEGSRKGRTARRRPEHGDLRLAHHPGKHRAIPAAAAGHDPETLPVVRQVNGDITESRSMNPRRCLVPPSRSRRTWTRLPSSPSRTSAPCAMECNSSPVTTWEYELPPVAYPLFYADQAVGAGGVPGIWTSRSPTSCINTGRTLHRPRALPRLPLHPTGRRTRALSAAVALQSVATSFRIRRAGSRRRGGDPAGQDMPAIVRRDGLLPRHAAAVNDLYTSEQTSR